MGGTVVHSKGLLVLERPWTVPVDSIADLLVVGEL